MKIQRLLLIVGLVAAFGSHRVGSPLHESPESTLLIG